MAHVLLGAEKRIFAIKQACGAEIGSPAAFAEACRVRTLIGYHFRGGLHSLGTAIDIDPELNPYVPTRLGDRYGGERTHKGWNPDELAPHIFKPVVDAFDRASRLWFGKDAEVGWAADPSEPFDSIWERFYAAHAALVAYLRLAFDPLPLGSRLGEKGVVLSSPGVKGETAHAPSSLSTFCDRLRARWRADPKLQALHEDWRDVMSSDAADAARASRFEPLYRAVVEDHETLRRGWVHGSPIPVREGGKKTGAVQDITVPESRDPCWGFLNLDYDVARVLRQELKLRWGLVDFAGASGDCMHFDLGGQGLKRVPPLVQSRTAAQERTFYTMAAPPVITEVYVREREKETRVKVRAGSRVEVSGVRVAEVLVIGAIGLTLQSTIQWRTASSPWTTARAAALALPQIRFAIPEEFRGKAVEVRVRSPLPRANSRETVALEVAP